MRWTHGLHYADGQGEKNGKLWGYFEDSISEQKASSNGSTLLQAAFQGNDLLVKSLIQAGSNIAVENDIGQSALHAAAMGGHAETVKYLLQAGAINTREDKRGNLALHDAVTFGHTTVAKILIETSPASIGQCNVNGDSPLDLAVRKGHEEVVALLSGHSEDSIRGASLIYALKKGHQKTVKVLLGNFAGNMIDQVSLDDALREASGSGYVEIVKLLLSAGANVNPKLIRKAPLHRACEKGHEEIVKLLLAAGADVDAGYGWNSALCSASKPGFENTVKALLAAGGRKLVSRHGSSALWCASREGHERVVELLTQAGVPSSGLDFPLSCASSEGHANTVKLLLSAGANPSTHDHWREPPLHSATQKGHAEIVQLLLSAGADVNKVYDIYYREKPESALEVASSGGYEEITQQLLKANADINQGEPLVRASKNGHVNIVKLLLGGSSDGIRLNAHQCQSAVEAALTYGFDNILELLLIAYPEGAQDAALKGASIAGHANTVKLLLNVNALSKELSVFGWCDTLDIASECGHIEIVKLLLEAGTDFDKSSCDSWYLSKGLVGASANGHRRVVELLLAEPTLNFDINTALSVASANGHEKVVELLHAASIGARHQIQETEAMQPWDWYCNDNFPLSLQT